MHNEAYNNVASLQTFLEEAHNNVAVYFVALFLLLTQTCGRCNSLRWNRYAFIYNNILELSYSESCKWAFKVAL